MPSAPLSRPESTPRVQEIIAAVWPTLPREDVRQITVTCKRKRTTCTCEFRPDSPLELILITRSSPMRDTTNDPGLPPVLITSPKVDVLGCGVYWILAFKVPPGTSLGTAMATLREQPQTYPVTAMYLRIVRA